MLTTRVPDEASGLAASTHPMKDLGRHADGAVEHALESPFSDAQRLGNIAHAHRRVVAELRNGP
jgi:hypothetical protein